MVNSHSSHVSTNILNEADPLEARQAQGQLILSASSACLKLDFFLLEPSREVHKSKGHLTLTSLNSADDLINFNSTLIKTASPLTLEGAV